MSKPPPKPKPVPHPHPHPHEHKLISIIVPYQPDSCIRRHHWNWLKRYYKRFMPPPGVEIIVHRSVRIPWPWSKSYRKTQSVNKAFKKAKGDIIVILDADCYIDYETIYECARRIREARDSGFPLWYVPYRRFYRLTAAASKWVTEQPVQPPWVYFGDPPEWWEFAHDHGPSGSHWWGALIQIMPREAFVAAGGMDEKFIGWGAEDIAFMYAVDTLYGPHKTFDGPTYHLWHPSKRFGGIPLWRGQHTPNGNSLLGTRYHNALGDRVKMFLLTRAESLGAYERYIQRLFKR